MWPLLMMYWTSPQRARPSPTPDMFKLVHAWWQVDGLHSIGMLSSCCWFKIAHLIPKLAKVDFGVHYEPLNNNSSINIFVLWLSGYAIISHQIVKKITIKLPVYVNFATTVVKKGVDVCPDHGLCQKPRVFFRPNVCLRCNWVWSWANQSLLTGYVEENGLAWLPCWMLTGWQVLHQRWISGMCSRSTYTPAKPK